MEAIVLVGGYGTRLRPLTFTMNKPLIPFCNKPILEHQIEALMKVGVNRIILAVCHRPDDMGPFNERMNVQHGIEVIFSIEDSPLGTAGPLALAKKHLSGNGQFFVLNSDIICNFPFESLLLYHREHGAEGTIVVTKVEDPSKFGVVLAEDNGKIQQFVEKPKEFVGDKINAGMYCFNKSILNRIKPVPTSIEREIFPAMAKDGQLYRFDFPGYWMDIGEPRDFLAGACLYLASTKDQKSTKTIGKIYRENVMVHDSARVGSNCVIGPNVVIGANCVIDNGVRLKRCILLDGVHVKRGALIDSSIIGWRSKIGEWSHLDDLCVLGEEVNIANEVHLKSAIVCPQKSVKQYVLEDTVIL